MDLLEIFKVDVKVYEVVRFLLSSKNSLPSVNMAVFRFLKEILSVNVLENGYR